MNADGIIQVGEPCSMRDVVCSVLVLDIFDGREDRLGDVSYMEEATRNIKVPDVFIDAKFASCNEESTP